ncbi:hypothetical protein C8F01DRAFT_1352274 [Mycena amicta]|nr:hypothetical protein C8F01DRAFT_1352274 [Mycena amicta]
MAQKSPFPATLPFDEPPPIRGTLVDSRATPLYILAWRFDRFSIPLCPISDTHGRFIRRWVKNCNENPPLHILPRPAIKTWVRDIDDIDLYFAVATNVGDPTRWTMDDFEYAKDALPEVHGFLEVNVDETFMWYRMGKSLWFPATLPFDQPPPLRGSLVDNRATPLYILAWRFDRFTIPLGPISDTDGRFLRRWVKNCNENPPHHVLPRPAIKTWVRDNDDIDLYFTVAANVGDHTKWTMADFKYAKDALPEVHDFLDVDVDASFMWYRMGKGVRVR